MRREPANQPDDDKKRDYDAMAAAMSRLEADFALEIAAVIQAQEVQQ